MPLAGRDRAEGGVINLPAVVIAVLVTGLLIIGTKESARVNAVLVVVKVTALTVFVILTLPVINGDAFPPVHPQRLGRPIGVVGAAASIFFAYVGFDAVSTAAEETKNPQRNVPIGLIGSLADLHGLLPAGRRRRDRRDRRAAGPRCSPAQSLLARDRRKWQRSALRSSRAARSSRWSARKEALAHVLRSIGYQRIGDLMGLAAFIALPSVVLMMMFGQTRIFFVMARDGLLPDKLADGPSEVPDAACRHCRHRHRRDARGGLPAGRQAGRLFELGHPVRLRDGGARR